MASPNDRTWTGNPAVISLLFETGNAVAHSSDGSERRAHVSN